MGCCELDLAAAVNTDDLFAQMQADEEHDRVAGQTKATPIDYARLRGMRPQKVYAALRNGRLEWSSCECGRRVIVIAEADALFKIQTQTLDSELDDDRDSTGLTEDVQEEEEVPGSDLDATFDERGV
jgi:hypothetical protein